jgi:hypothetical protein
VVHLVVVAAAAAAAAAVVGVVVDVVVDDDAGDADYADDDEKKEEVLVEDDEDDAVDVAMMAAVAEVDVDSVISIDRNCSERCHYYYCYYFRAIDCYYDCNYDDYSSMKENYCPMNVSNSNGNVSVAIRCCSNSNVVHFDFHCLNLTNRHCHVFNKKNRSYVMVSFYFHIDLPMVRIVIIIWIVII